MQPSQTATLEVKEPQEISKIPFLGYPYEPTDDPYWDCECVKDYIRPTVARFQKGKK